MDKPHYQTIKVERPAVQPFLPNIQYLGRMADNRWQATRRQLARWNIHYRVLEMARRMAR